MIRTWKLFNDRIGFVALIPVIGGIEQENGWLTDEEEIENYINSLENAANKVVMIGRGHAGMERTTLVEGAIKELETVLRGMK